MVPAFTLPASLHLENRGAAPPGPRRPAATIPLDARNTQAQRFRTMPKPVGRPARQDRDLAKALFIQGCRNEVICSTVGIQPNLLRAWISRYKWRDLTATVQQTYLEQGKRSLAVETALTLQSMGDQIRAQLSQELASQTALLASNPPRSVNDLGTTKHGQGRASVVKTIAEAAGLVHDWGTEVKTGLVLVAELGQEPEARPAIIDIQAITQAPDPVAAEGDPTTGSVPEPIAPG